MWNIVKNQFHKKTMLRIPLFIIKIYEYFLKS
jgi:hypothetical protein